MTNSIFPGLVPDVETYMVQKFVDSKSLVALSGVSRYAYEVLSNDSKILPNGEVLNPYTNFKYLFSVRYPHLLQFKNACAVLTENNPSNCWKILCSELTKPARSINFSVFFIREALDSKIKQLNNKINEMCCPKYEESSPIDKVQVACRKCDSELAVLEKKLNSAIEEIPFESRNKAICHNFLTFTETELKDEATFRDACLRRFNHPRNPRLNPDNISSYYPVATLLHQFIKKYDELARYLSEHQKLNDECTKHVGQRNDLNQSLERLGKEGFVTIYGRDYNDSLVKSHINAVTQLLNFSKQLGQNQNRFQILDNCSKLLDDILSKDQEYSPSSAELAAVKDAINSDRTDAAKIWKSLYDQCGKGIIEDSWAEIHFSNYLPELATIIKNHIKALIDEIEKNQKQLQGCGKKGNGANPSPMREGKEMAKWVINSSF